MKDLLPTYSFVLATRREERLANYLAPFFEHLGYEFSIESAEEYGDEAAVLKLIKR